MKKSLKGLIILGSVVGVAAAVTVPIVVASNATTQQSSNVATGLENVSNAVTQGTEIGNNNLSSQSSNESSQQGTTSSNSSVSQSTQGQQSTSKPGTSTQVSGGTSSNATVGSSNSQQTGKPSANNNLGNIDQSVMKFMDKLNRESVEDSSTTFSIKKVSESSARSSRKARSVLSYGNNASVGNESEVESGNASPETASTYQLTIKTSSQFEQYGSIEFITKDGGTSTNAITAQPGDTVKVKVTMKNNDYTLTDLKIFSEGNPSITLGIQKVDNNTYSFTLPQEKLDDGSLNPFYQPDNNSLTVRAKFGPNKYNDWTYDIESKSYNIVVTEDNWVFDDVKNTNLKLVGGKLEHNPDEDEIPGENVIQYRIYLQGHDMKIKNMTIPSAAQLMFINNPENSSTNGKTPTISLESDTYMFPPEENGKYGKFDVKGVVGRWGSVSYEGRLQQYLEAR